MASLDVVEFIGGLVDEYIGAAPNKWRLADNFIITQDRKAQNRPGSRIDFPGSTRSRVTASGGSRRVGLVVPAYGTNIKQVVSTLQYDTGAALAELLGPAGASAFVPVTSDNASFCYSNWNGHSYITHDALNQRPVKIYSTTNDATGLRLRTAGLPKPSGAPVFNGEVGSGSSFLYAFVYKYTYAVNGVTFVDRSAPMYVTRVAATPATTITVTPLALTNASGQHYDVASANLVIEAYRTNNNGTVFYFAGEIANGAATITIAWAATNALLYTTGGVAENDRPPIAKYVHATTGFGYYGHIIDINSGETLRNVLVQSKQSDPDSVPSRFNVELAEEIVGVSSVRSIPVVFTKTAIYRIDGFYDLLGRGGMNPIKISDSIGGIGQLSLVQTLEWLYFASSDGFYRTNGYDIQRLSDNEMNSFTAQYVTFLGTTLKEKRVYGVNDVKEDRVLWAVEKVTFENSGDNNSIMAFDTRNGVFTSWSSGFSELNERYKTQFRDNFRPTAMSILDGVFYRAGTNGYTFKHETNTLTDPRINTAVADTNLWEVNPIIYDLTMAAVDFGLSGVRKWVESIIVKGKSVVDFNVANPTAFNTTLRISSDNDSKQSFTELAEIYNRNQLVWGDPDVPYGDPRLWQSRFGIYDVKRMFNSLGGLRCAYKQMRFTNLFANIASSDIRGIANISGSTVTMPQITMSVNTSIGLNVVTVVSTSSPVAVGMGIIGAGGLSIPSGSIITEIISPTSIRISNNATANSAPIAATAARLFPLGVNNYWMTFASDNYVSEFVIVSRGGTVPGSQVTVSGSPNSNPTNKWVMKGFFKGDAICLLGYTINFVPLSDTQAPFRGVSGGNK